METFEWVIVLMLGAAVLSLLSRRLGLPLPSLLAVGGAAIALVPFSPNWALDPHLALTLFVAPVLLDAAYDFSLRDLKRNWITVAGLAVMAVIVTTLAVAVVVRWLVPDMPWPIAIALGAIVAPPDAAAATAVMRQVRLPHRIRTILEGESLINDASALLVYRIAIGAAMAGNVSAASIAPTALYVVVGSFVAGLVLAQVMLRTLPFIDDAPTAIVIQFVGTFGVWMLADGIGLSGVLTIVVFAITAARSTGSRLNIPARMRIPTNAVWATVVFILNALAFVLIGMQLRPILSRLDGSGLTAAVLTALAVLATAIVARFAWVMIYNALLVTLVPGHKRDAAGRPVRTVGGSLVISWAGMRGIVTLAAAFALPTTLADGSPFPYRDLLLLSAFFVVLGTLVVQGLTLRPLIALLQLEAPDPVVAEVRQARIEALRAGIAAIDADRSEEANLLREEFEATIETNVAEQASGAPVETAANATRLAALAAARKRANELWLAGTIGDEAYRTLESEFDWGELGAGAD